VWRIIHRLADVAEEWLRPYGERVNTCFPCNVPDLLNVNGLLASSLFNAADGRFCHRLGLETVPDLRGFALANDLVGKSDDEIRAAMGEKFPKHIYHSIVCIGALVAHRKDGCCFRRY
jgi:hypothetical protein